MKFFREEVPSIQISHHANHFHVCFLRNTCTYHADDADDAKGETEYKQEPLGNQVLLPRKI